MTTAKKADPTLTEVSISYSIGVKANLGNYESGDVHISKSERWNVEGLTESQIAALYNKRYETLREELGPRIEDEYEELLTGRGKKR